MIRLISLLLSRVNLKLTFGAVIAIALVAFLYVWHYQPIERQKSEIEKQRSELLRKQEILRDLIQKLSALKEQRAREIFEEKQKAIRQELQKLQQLEASQYDKKDINLSIGAHTIVIH